MNREKAREFFSSYAEGSLDAGLRSSFEQRLGSDSDLQREFNSFRRSFDELDGLRFVSSSVPGDLHDKIAARLDLHVWQQKQAAAPGWTGWLRNLAIGGVATAAVVGAVLSIFNHDTSASAANLIGFTPNQLQASPVSSQDRDVRVRYLATGKHLVTVTSGSTQLRQDSLTASERWETTLTNNQPHSALFKVQVSDGGGDLEVAVPGKAGSHSKGGEGTVEDLAKALAETYRVPVILSGHNLAQSVKWKFEGAEVSEAAGQALTARGFTVEVKGGNAIWITQNN